MKLASLSLAAVLAFGGTAFAQTTTPAPGSDPAMPAPETTTPAPEPTTPVPDTTAPDATLPDADVNPGLPTDQPDEPLTQGANSFTEAQARDWIEEAGYTDVTGLVQSEDGIWRGHARRDGATVQVAVDYKGTVSTE